MAELGPRLGTVAVPGVGHNVRAEAPEAYADLLKAWLRSL